MKNRVMSVASALNKPRGVQNSADENRDKQQNVLFQTLDDE
jgi:hypothetical protein